MTAEQLNEWAALQTRDKAELYATVSHVQRLEAENRRLRETLDYVSRESRAKKGNLGERMEVIHDEVNYALRKGGP